MPIDAGSAADQFISGDLYVGGGVRGAPYGTYFATSEDVAKNYATGVNPLFASRNPGAVIYAAIPSDARIVSYTDPQLLADFAASGFDNIGAFAAARGYDAMVIQDGIHVVLNRSALVVADQPSMFMFGNANPVARSAAPATTGAARGPSVAVDLLDDDVVSTPNVARGATRAPRVTLRASEVERVEGIGEHWFRMPDPDNPRSTTTIPGVSGGGRLGGRPMGLREVPDEVYHVTTNASGVKADGMINVSSGAGRGAGGSSGSGAVSTTASREIAENLQLDLRAFASLKNARTLDEVLDILMDTSRAQGMSEEAVALLRQRVEDSVPSIVGRNGFNPEDHAKSVFNSWEFIRRLSGGPRPSIIIGDPFSDYWKLVRVEDIDIIPVSKKQIPEGALINDYDLGRGGLEEIQIYADIPLTPTPNVARGR
jgi:hypothetical protein